MQHMQVFIELEFWRMNDEGSLFIYALLKANVLHNYAVWQQIWPIMTAALLIQ